MPAEPVPAPVTATPAPVNHSQMDHSQMDHGDTEQPASAGGEHADHAAMKGALGPYPVTRESSGTAWQPDTSEHSGWMKHSGDWMLMGHGVLNLVTTTNRAAAATTSCLRRAC